MEAVVNKKIFPLLKEQPVPSCLQPVFALDNIALKLAVASPHGRSGEALQGQLSMGCYAAEPCPI